MLLEWRNDPDTRAACRDTAEVSREQHLAWLVRTLSDDSRNLLILERDGVPVATARFDAGDPPEFSLTIAPEARCKGRLPLLIMQLAIRCAPRSVSFIRRENTACQRLYRAAGGYMARDGDLQEWRFEGCHSMRTEKMTSSGLRMPVTAVSPASPVRADA